MPHATLCGMSKRFSLGTVVQERTFAGPVGRRSRPTGPRNWEEHTCGGGRGGQAAVFDDKKQGDVGDRQPFLTIRNG